MYMALHLTPYTPAPLHPCTLRFQAQGLCGYLQQALNDPRFPRNSVSPDAKNIFLESVGAMVLKRGWSGVKV